MALAAARDRAMEQSCWQMQWPDLDVKEGAQTKIESGYIVGQ
jgi:hypothetical protein